MSTDTLIKGDPARLAEKMQHDSVAYWIVVLQGFGLLLPWNIVLNTVPYFQASS
jgi:hypothetical protein